MIVKDEAELLGGCLDALVPFVDEVVVYDTGSTDATLAVARGRAAAGAVRTVVVEGSWDDHFGDARNRALDHATGDWVLQVDADDVVTGDPGALRERLDAEAHDHVVVPYVSTPSPGATTGHESRPVRLVRRGSSRWTGALHEHPTWVEGHAPAGRSPVPAPLRVLHSGHHPERLVAKDKFARNARIAALEVEAVGPGSPDRVRVLSTHARCLVGAGRVDEALGVVGQLEAEVERCGPGNPSALLAAARQVLPLLLARGETAAAARWVDLAGGAGESAGAVAVARAEVALAAGDAPAALDHLLALTGTDGGEDLWGLPFDPAHLDAAASRVLAALAPATTPTA